MADRNHMHHILLDIGMSQRQAALSLFVVNLIFIFTALALRNISSLILLFVIIVMAIVLSIVPITIRNWQRSKAINAKTAL